MPFCLLKRLRRVRNWESRRRQQRLLLPSACCDVMWKGLFCLSESSSCFALGMDLRHQVSWRKKYNLCKQLRKFDYPSFELRPSTK